ncbi:MAG: hypothetical protein ACKO8P_03150, partial [Actinomycetota bacterium]
MFCDAESRRSQNFERLNHTLVIRLRAVTISLNHRILPWLTHGLNMTQQRITALVLLARRSTSRDDIRHHCGGSFSKTCGWWAH